jgi:anaphase-promoting complex subunit 8
LFVLIDAYTNQPNGMAHNITKKNTRVNCINRSAEVLDGINTSWINNNDKSYTKSDFNLPCISTYHTNYESSLEPLTELEYNKYQYAKTLFSIKQFDAVSFVLDGFEAPKLLFLKLYAQYLVRHYSQ